MPIRHGGRLASRVCTCPRDHFCRSMTARLSGAIRTYLPAATADHAGSSNGDLVPDAAGTHGRQSETMERYHEGTYHRSRPGHADLGPELRPTRRFRTALQQLVPGQPQLRQQRVLTTERLRSEACRVSDWSK